MPLGKLLRTLVFSLAIAAPLAMLSSGCGDGGGGGTDAENSLPPEDDPTLTEDDSTMIDDPE